MKLLFAILAFLFFFDATVSFKLFAPIRVKVRRNKNSFRGKAIRNQLNQANRGRNNIQYNNKQRYRRGRK